MRKKLVLIEFIHLVHSEQEGEMNCSYFTLIKMKCSKITKLHA